MYYTKKIHGHVTQMYQDGVCIGQYFTAGNTVEYEDEQNHPISSPDNETDQDYHMVLETS